MIQTRPVNQRLPGYERQAGSQGTEKQVAQRALGCWLVTSTLQLLVRNRVKGPRAPRLSHWTQLSPHLSLLAQVPSPTFTICLPLRVFHALLMSLQKSPDPPPRAGKKGTPTHTKCGAYTECRGNSFKWCEAYLNATILVSILAAATKQEVSHAKSEV